MGICQKSSYFLKVQIETSSLQRLCHAAQKTVLGLIIFRANKQDFGVFVEAEQDDGREN